MKKIMLFTLPFISLMASAITVEKDAVISKDYRGNTALFNQAAGLIRATGYRCDSLSALVPMTFATGFYVTCNRYRYKYTIQDKGGRWVAELDD